MERRGNDTAVTAIARSKTHALPLAHALPLSYVLPVKWGQGGDLAELTRYLRWLSSIAEVIVVDGSQESVFERHHAALHGITHVCPAQWADCLNGKVAGVLTGVSRATHEKVIVADDDVRYDAAGLARVVQLLDTADLLVVGNYFDPAPWHARWDMSRSLVNRAVFGGDYPGTLALRGSVFHSAGGYDGDVLFENLELMRTMTAVGAQVWRCPDLPVRRLPPTTAKFLSQRVRQAYDSTAQPGRLAVELSVLPAVIALGVARGPRQAAAAASLTAMAVATAGRLRLGGKVFPASTPLFAPLWCAERAVCSWIAMGCYVRGGVRYGAGLIRTSAHSTSQLRRRQAGRQKTDSACESHRSTA